MEPSTPQANVTDQPAPEAPVKIDPPLNGKPVRAGVFGGRLNRRGYIMGDVYLALGFLVLVTVTMILYFVDRRFTALGVIMSIVTVAYAVFATVIHVGLIIRRLHDAGQTGLFALLLLVPGANTVLGIALLFIPGSIGPNTYGDGPQPTLGPRDVTGL